jgi:hypothetical protein
MSMTSKNDLKAQRGLNKVAADIAAEKGNGAHIIDPGAVSNKPDRPYAVNILADDPLRIVPVHGGWCIYIGDRLPECMEGTPLVFTDAAKLGDFILGWALSARES